MAVIEIGKPPVFSYHTTQTESSALSGAGGIGGVTIVNGFKTK